MTERDKALDFREFHVDSIALIGKDGVALDIRNLVQELVLRQDIVVGYMHGEMLILDAIDAFQQMDITGGEYVWIKLTSPFCNYEIARSFRVFKVTDRKVTKNDAQRYNIHIVSDEMYLSNLIKISKAYKGESISTIAEDIITNNLDCDKYTIDSTDKSHDIIIPNWRPTEALNWLASRAVNGDKHTWLFYENLDGLQFRCLYKLYEQPVVNDIPFIQETTSINKNLDRSKYAIDNLTFKRDFDIIRLSNAGGVATQFLGIDPVARTITVTESSQRDMLKLHDKPYVPDVKLINGNNLYDNYEANRLAYIQTPDNQAESWHKNIMSLAALYNNMCEVTVSGNMDIQAGSMVNVDFRIIRPMPEISDMNEVMSGAYFVSSVTHIFHMETNQFDTTFGMFRDSLPQYGVAPDMNIVEKAHKL